MTHITKFKPHAYYLAANFFCHPSGCEAKLLPESSHTKSSKQHGGNTRKTPVPLLELSICSLYLSFYFYKGPTLLPSRWMNQLGTMQLAIDRERH